MNLAGNSSVSGTGVAVIIPARDAEPWIETAILSALNQPETDEVVVVDDGSRDRTSALIASLAERNNRLVCLRPEGVPMGPGAARNLGARASRSNVLAFLDADDFFMPSAFSAALSQLVDPSVDVVLSRINVLHLGLEGRTVEYDPSPLLARDWLDALCLGETGMQVCTALVRRSAFDRVGGFDETLQLGQDLVLWLKLACCVHASLSNGPRPVAVYRRHGRNRSDLNGSGPVQAGVWACLRAWRWSLIARIGQGASKKLLRGAGLRQRQLISRALKGDVRAGVAALLVAASEPLVVANLGFWAGRFGVNAGNTRSAGPRP